MALLRYWGLKLMAALVTLGGTSQPMMAQQETFYYRKGEKVPLKVDPSRVFVLFTPETTEQDISEPAKSVKAVLRRFETYKVPTGLNLIQEPPAKGAKWAIIDNGDASAALFDKAEISKRVLYRAPFVLTKDNKQVGMSHLVYVKLKAPDDKAKLEALAKELKVVVVGNNKFMPLWYTLACTKESAGNALEVANKLYESEHFTTAEPDFLADFQIKCANDPHFGKQWGLKNTGQNGWTAGMDVGVCDAWTVATGKGVKVAVLDHGIQLNHPDMQANISSMSFDTVTGTSPSQVRGNHGTACAGIIGASRDNSLGVAGVAPDATLISISDRLVLGPDAQQQLANGLSWAWQNGADVISNSWGHDLLASALIEDAIEEALTNGRGGKGCVVVFAAGNHNGSIIFPANSNPAILAVGAMSPCGERKNPMSCDGESWWGSCFGSTLDIVAPGVKIPTTDRTGSDGYDSGDYVLTFNGTSSATPHVAGVAALILEVNPALTQQQVVEMIEKCGRKVGQYTYLPTTGRPNGDWHEEMGYGLVDAKACVQAARETAPGGGAGSAEKFTAGEGLLQSLPSGPELKGAEAEDSTARAAGFSWYNNVGVNVNTGLTGTEATQVSVYVRDIRWRYAFNGPDVTSPTGDGGSGGSGWQFPNAHKFGIVVFQGNNYWNITSTSPSNPTVITGLSNTQPIRVMVNDTTGNYSDNSGAFDIYVRKDN